MPEAYDGPPSTFRWFVPAASGRFVARPNRFIVQVEVEGKIVTCHCPNPGRMGELLFPGTPVLLEAAAEGRKTAFTLAAIIHQPLDGSLECVVPVGAGRANQAVGTLVLPRLFPGARRIKPEHTIGHSRFDFLVEEPPVGSGSKQPRMGARGGRPATEPLSSTPSGLAGPGPADFSGPASHAPAGSPNPGPDSLAVAESTPDLQVSPEALRRHLVEVKAVTEVEFGTACFPDAPSLRASRHVQELTHLGRESGVQPGKQADPAWHTHVIFALTHSRPTRLVPNLHTDPEFARAVAEAAGSVDFHAVQFVLDREGWCRLADQPDSGLPLVRVDTSFGDLAAANRGNYFVTLEIGKDMDIEPGALGLRHFDKGWYVYCGSAAKNLRQRMARQIRKTGKARHWHLDWLVPHAKEVKAHGIATTQNMECLMAQGLANQGARGIPGFGSSDCGCPSHLYHFAVNPLRDRGFQTLLMRLRHQTSLGD